jgi:hypothetical protein
MAGNGSERGGKRTAFVAAIATGQTVAGASQIALISERTGYRWASEPGVQQQVQALRGNLTSAALGRLLSHVTKAADKMGELVGSESDGIALQAAGRVLTIVLDFRKATEMDARMAAIEKQLLEGQEEQT